MTNVNPREFAPPGTMEQVRDYWSHRQTAYADHETAVREIRAAMDNLNCAVEDAYGPSSRSHLNGSCVSSEQLRKLHAWMELQTEARGCRRGAGPGVADNLCPRTCAATL
jgi:hypothetical protein